MVEPPRLMPHCACWGRGDVTRPDARPGRGWCAHAGVGGRTLDRHGAPAVAGLLTPGRGGGGSLVGGGAPGDATQRQQGQGG